MRCYLRFSACTPPDVLEVPGRSMAIGSPLSSGRFFREMIVIIPYCVTVVGVPLVALTAIVGPRIDCMLRGSARARKMTHRVRCGQTTIVIRVYHRRPHGGGLQIALVGTHEPRVVGWIVPPFVLPG